MSNFVFERENPEFLAVLEAVSVDKGLKKDVINKAVESAVKDALVEYFQGSYDPQVSINRNTGAVSVFKNMHIVQEVQDPHKEIDIIQAIVQNPEAKIGEDILLPLKVSTFSSNTIRHIGNLIGKEILTQEKEAEYSHFLKLKGFVVNCVVKKVFPHGLLVAIDKHEAFIKKYDLLPTEREMNPGQRLDALVYEVRRSDVESQALLTRSSPEFLFELLKQGIPEIMDETIQVKAIARDAGSRAKVALLSKDTTINPVVLCANHYSKRQLTNISKALGGERVEVVEWNEDLGTFMMNALKPPLGEDRESERGKRVSEFRRTPQKQIKVEKITVDYDNKNIEVIVDEEHISLAIGRKGQNVRLLSKLLGCPIHFVTKEESSQKKFDEITSRAVTLVNELNLDETVAQLLVVENLDTVEKIADAKITTIAGIEGFDEEVATLVRDRALHFLSEKAKIDDENLKVFKEKAGKLASEINISEETALEFIKIGVETRENLAEYSAIEIIEDLNLKTLEPSVISEVIMKARGF